MVYSTCSMNPIENEAVVAEWLHNLQTENGILANGRMTLKEVLIQAHSTQPPPLKPTNIKACKNAECLSSVPSRRFCLIIQLPNEGIRKKRRDLKRKQINK
ncbi:uncharacterized protein [Cicer arietinum]|uniref:uncharacterized protein isoform X3 n=1 Tax=Cicer arietinum TaxID=3827 RepID=UPI00032A8476